MDQLKSARAKINDIDRKMAALFEERMEAVTQVAAYKKEKGMPVLDASREKEVISRCASYMKNRDLCRYYEKVLEKEMEMSRAYQQKILGREKVGYQGVEGAFSHIAAHRLFPMGTLQKFGTFTEVFEAVEKEQIFRGIIPFENSFTGEVGEVLDLLYAHDVYIESIYDQPVCQNLLVVPGAKLQDIKSVYSHTQALQQAEEFLNTVLPEAERIPYANTAEAAKFVAESCDKTIAAVASEMTAELYGLHIAASGINTSKDNTTRFIVITKEMPEKGNRFNLLFTVDHTAGQLARIISIIGDMGFNLESIKSRSVRGEPWKYYFYAEVVGTLEDPTAQKLIEELQQRCATVKILGHYRKDV